MTEGDGRPPRGFYRQIAEFYLRMARRTPSEVVRIHHLDRAAEWREKASADDKRMAEMPLQPDIETPDRKT
jgi:hypothetical protein